MNRLAALSALVLGLAGCGGAGGSAVRQKLPLAATPAPGSVAPRASLTQAEKGFASSADEVCRHLDAPLISSRPKGSALTEIAHVIPHRAALELKAVAEMEKLKPPAGIAADWRKIIAERRILAKELAELGHDARVLNVGGIQVLSVSKSKAHRKLREVATGDGFKYCGEVG